MHLIFLWRPFFFVVFVCLCRLVTGIESAVKCLTFKQKPFFLISAIKSAAKCLIFKRRPLFGPLKWWWRAGTLLGLAHRTKKLPTPVVHEHCTKAQSGARVKKVWKSLVYTDGSKPDGRVGAGFIQNTHTTPQNKHFSTLEYTALCSKQKS